MGYHQHMKRNLLPLLASFLVILVMQVGTVDVGYSASNDPGAADYVNSMDAESDKASAASASAAKTDLKSPNFKFSANDISPSNNKDYTKGSGNIPLMVKRITEWLLIIVSTGTVLFIIVGGLFMATSAGDEDRSTKGKTIITYNIQALVIAMMSYGIIQLLIWILSPTG